VSRPSHQAFASFVDSHADEQLEFLVELCHQNSYTYHKAGTDRVAEMMLGKIRDLFPVHQTVDQTEVGNHHILRTVDGEPSIVLLGHMDTVFRPDHPFQRCELDGERLRGPGTGDMKGGLTVIAYALLALEHAGLLDGLPLTVILGGDEEIGSATSRWIYERERERALACLVTECAGLNGEIVVSRNGKLGAQLDCHGRDRHVGFGTHEKSSAILELAHKIVALEALNATLPGVSLNVGRIEGGLGPATIPASASAAIDVRWQDQGHHEALVESITAIVSATVQPECHSEFTVLNQRPAMPLLDGSERLSGLIEGVAAELGQFVGRQHRRGTSDANFFGSVGVPTVDGLGPISDRDHTPEEYIVVASLRQRTVLLASVLAAMSGNLDVLAER